MSYVTNIQANRGEMGIAEIDETTGAHKGFDWLGDATDISANQSQEKESFMESFTGKNLTEHEWALDTGVEVNFTMNNLSAKNLVIAVAGSLTSNIAGTVTSESLNNGVFLEAGKNYPLSKQGKVSNVVAVDSAGSPVTLVQGTNYQLDADFAEIKLLDIASLTTPILVDYDYEAFDQIAMLDSDLVIRRVRFKLKNIAIPGKRSIVEYYRMQINIAETIDLLKKERIAIPMKMKALADFSQWDGSNLNTAFGQMIH